jgi:hypothetical protein
MNKSHEQEKVERVYWGWKGFSVIKNDEYR